MNQRLSLTLALVLFLMPLFTACSADVTPAASALRMAPKPVAFTQLQSGVIAASHPITSSPYLEQLNIPLDQVKYLPLIEQALPLNSDERTLLTNNGFVVSDRISWRRFIEAYAWIYWKDLPVVVTTDALLHALHQSYNDLLEELELTILKPQLTTMLEATLTTLVSQRQANTDVTLAPLYTDVETYLDVALHLLDAQGSDNPVVQNYVALATEANASSAVQLFGTARQIDFTLFKPRGHYVEEPWLQNYFRAMSWLGQIDFRFVSYDPLTNEATLDQPQIAAAFLLRNAIDATDQRLRWGVINGMLEVLIGRSDNMTLPDFDHFLTDAALFEPAQVLTADAANLLNLLTTNDYGQQRITGQLLMRDVNNPSDQPIPRPSSFLLLGQRFALDAFIFSELVYDRLMVNGEPVRRALPSPLDAMMALGNDRALTHLQGELTQYQYEPHLTTLRQTIEGLPGEFWRTPIYNQWLGLLRTLNLPTTGDSYPQAMRTAAWADKTLQTQLGSWTQLRHDNMLYVKQSFSSEEVLCEYPAGYVEPYPAFYVALQQLAQDVRLVLGNVPLRPNDTGNATRARVFTYLDNLIAVSSQLQTLAEKELRLEEFSEQEELFLKSIIKRQVKYYGDGCDGPITEDLWDGWYAHLFYKKDDNPALIADVHTNPTNDPMSPLYPPRVLHAATGPVAAELLIINTDEGMAIYVGPAFSYFEIVTEGNETTPPERLDDKQWRNRLRSAAYPAAPAWTQSFRLATQTEPTALTLPVFAAVGYPQESPEQTIFLPLIQQ